MFNFSTSPMFNSQTEASSMSEQPGTDGVADINPDDIESISMLTGPSAAALYGNAAASGVVLITTKKGQADRTVVTLSNSTTFSRVYMMPRMQSKYGNAVGQIVSWGSRVDSDYDPGITSIPERMSSIRCRFPRVIRKTRFTLRLLRLIRRERFPTANTTVTIFRPAILRSSPRINSPSTWGLTMSSRPT